MPAPGRPNTNTRGAFVLLLCFVVLFVLIRQKPNGQMADQMAAIWSIWFGPPNQMEDQMNAIWSICFGPPNK